MHRFRFFICVNSFNSQNNPRNRHCYNPCLRNYSTKNIGKTTVKLSAKGRIILVFSTNIYCMSAVWQALLNNYKRPHKEWWSTSFFWSSANTLKIKVLLMNRWKRKRHAKQQRTTNEPTALCTWQSHTINEVTISQGFPTSVGFQSCPAIPFSLLELSSQCHFMLFHHLEISKYPLLPAHS